MTMSSTLTTASLVFSLLVVAYFVLWNGSLIVMGLVATGCVRRHLRRHTRRARAVAGNLAMPPRVSVVVPAYNEALTIVESVRALLALDYEAREIVVVNDGSTDETMARMKEAFQLLAAPLAFIQPIPTKPVRGIYRSISEPGLVVIDKDNGGCKADGSNAGINAASGVLVLIIDADRVLEPDALSRAVLPFLEDARTVAVGANIGIINGCRVRDGRVTEVGLPRSWFARFQVVEYMRSFLMFRVACASINGLPIISGAFGLFRRDSLLAVGGYDTSAIGEDMDLTMRLHEYYRKRKEPFRIAFEPNILCWTQAPEDWASLQGQRYRWRRGLIQVLRSRRRLIGNPRFGVLGLGILPYVTLIEGCGPLLEVFGYLVTTVALLAGFLNWEHYRLIIAISILLGAAATMLAVLLNDLVAQRYMHGRDLFLLIAVAGPRNSRLSPAEFLVVIGRNRAGSDGQGWMGCHEAPRL